MLIRAPYHFCRGLLGQGGLKYWSGDWSEQTKRQVIKEARTFNEQRGTQSTLNQAMNNLGLGHNLTAWHELS